MRKTLELNRGTVILRDTINYKELNRFQLFSCKVSKLLIPFYWTVIIIAYMPVVFCLNICATLAALKMLQNIFLGFA